MPTTDDQENQPAPTSPTVTGQPPRQGRKPTRAERRLANQLARAKADVEAQAHANDPLAAQENRPAPASPLAEGHQPPHSEHRLQGEESGHLPVAPIAAGSGSRSLDAGASTQVGPGRPSEFTWDEADRLCAWIQAGGSLRGWTNKTGRAVSTVYRWMRESTQFHSLYSQAHEDRADTLTDEMLEIADAAATEATIEDVAAAKLRIEARKWIASKLRPQKWGDKQIVEHKGAVNIRIGIPAKPPATVLIESSDPSVIDV